MAVTLWGLTFGSTSSGFVVPTYAELRGAAAARIRSLRGIANLRVEPGAFFGNIIDLTVGAVDIALQGAQEAITRTIFNQATGNALDALLAGFIERVQASDSTAVVYPYGLAGAAFAAGTIVRTSPAGPAWTTDGAVVIPAAPAEAYAVELVAFSTGAYAGQAFTITVAGTPITYVANAGDDGASVRAGLVAAINAAGLTQTAYPGGTSPQNTRLNLLVIEKGGGGPFAISVAGPASTIFSFPAIASAVTASEPGAVLAPAGSLRYCSLPANIAGVTNPEDATEGLTEETDSQLRARWQIVQRGMGGGSPDAVRAIILSPVAVRGGGASYCIVEYNPTDVTDSAGNLPHSLRVVVDADADGQQVANALWRAKAAGDNTNGTESYTVTDAGVPPATHTIWIDRLVDVFIGVEIEIEVGVDWPATGSPLDQLRQDVTDYINDLQPTSNGGAVRVNLLPISTFPDGTPRGVVNFRVRVGDAASAGGPFTWRDWYPDVEPDADLASVILTGREKAVAVITDVTATIV